MFRSQCFRVPVGSLDAVAPKLARARTFRGRARALGADDAVIESPEDPGRNDLVAAAVLTARHYGEADVLGWLWRASRPDWERHLARLPEALRDLARAHDVVVLAATESVALDAARARGEAERFRALRALEPVRLFDGPCPADAVEIWLLEGDGTAEGSVEIADLTEEGEDVDAWARDHDAQQAARTEASRRAIRLEAWKERAGLLGAFVVIPALVCAAPAGSGDVGAVLVLSVIGALVAMGGAVHLPEEMPWWKRAALLAVTQLCIGALCAGWAVLES